MAVLAVVGAFVTAGAATGAAAMIVGGVVVGAVVGGITAAVTGGNILKGIITGGVIGGIVGGAGAALGFGGTAAAETGATAAGAGSGTLTAETGGAAWTAETTPQLTAGLSGATPSTTAGLAEIGTAGIGESLKTSVFAAPSIVGESTAATGVNGIAATAPELSKGTVAKDVLGKSAVDAAGGNSVAGTGAKSFWDSPWAVQGALGAGGKLIGSMGKSDSEMTMEELARRRAYANNLSPERLRQLGSVNYTVTKK